MREHMGLYRGKRVYGGRWVEGDLVPPNEIFAGCYIAHLEYLNEHGEVGMISDEVDPDTVGECTGLRDKNGKLIFEGDIVRHHNGNPYALPDIIEKGVVYWDEAYCGWQRTSNGAFHHGVVDTYRMSHSCVYEIIGNIHDNPELLKGGEG